MLRGLVEYVSRNCTRGWAAFEGRDIPHVYAVLDGRVIGIGRADIVRNDLEALEPPARAFVISYERLVSAEQVQAVRIHVVGQDDPLLVAEGALLDAGPVSRVFVLGAPCSGGPQMAEVLATSMSISRLQGGCIGAPFAVAAAALRGALGTEDASPRFVTRQDFVNPVIESARKAYYFSASAASFLEDDTGAGAITAAPFLAECFPDARFLYMERNGIPAVLAGLAERGGSLEEHCAGWSAAMEAWEDVRSRLPGSLAIPWEELQAHPEAVARQLATYLGCPHLARRFEESLRLCQAEQAGAQAWPTSLAAAGWSVEQQQLFRRICGAAMARHGYECPESEGPTR